MPPNTSHKRKLPFGGLQRRVRARREDIDPEIEEEHSEDEDGDDGDLSGGEGQIPDDESDSTPESEDDDEEIEREEDDPSSTVAQVSFGALAKAQASMPDIRRKKGRKTSNSEDEEEEEREEERRPTRAVSKSLNPPKPQRSSKHAPMEMSSKRQVSRKREVVNFNKVASRDPRFSAASGAVDETRARKAYAFLDEYRDSEMSQLKAAIKKTKSTNEKEELARTLKSMQSRKEAQAKRDAEHELIAQHRRQEKELVAQGKQPFYLKKSEQKKQLLLERFAGMKKKQVDRTIERRRKKLTARERKNMPIARRNAP
ncbi:hypothetical protein F5B22DRAFT_642669 [Xylaria bambusicola]|uniref:uncharacterized protein n=1 Tax=Xylaria bambusicola TaxID=326684 RepID=UPI002007A2CB|nr:uncharacterized protein F5B22DRAFT_642669 [Xylaria bambusicola]KAI0525661.1 hypothetical protein F5B22DRAFT_642669 [Xylaria bambusicola]